MAADSRAWLQARAVQATLLACSGDSLMHIASAIWAVCRVRQLSTHRLHQCTCIADHLLHVGCGELVEARQSHRATGVQVVC
jgi:hypothetical protein